MQNSIVAINNEIYNYLNDINYAMNKPQFLYLISIVNELISLPSTKLLSKISEQILTAKSISFVYRFLNYLMSTDIELDAQTIIKYYSIR